MTGPDHGLAPSLGAVWRALHRDIEFVILESEAHHLRLLALGADDDFVSHLLLRKLQIARIATGDATPDSRVALNSFCEYSIDGGDLSFCQLIRPSPCAPNYGVSVVSLAGAGLLGLRAGQTILWPGEAGALRKLHVARVENCPGLGAWLESTPRMEQVHA
jgi:regulator of nucleoside diphosphate kinase